MIAASSLFILAAALTVPAGAFVPATPGGLVASHNAKNSLGACSSCSRRLPSSHKRARPLCMGRRSEKIARTKGKGDAKRAKDFARCGKKIQMAVKAGGEDESTNKALADAIKDALANNLPKDNINRAIKRAMDSKEGNDFAVTVYEAYGHGGAGFIVSCLTDNINRANADVKLAMRKNGMSVAATGSVAFQFSRKGRLATTDAVDEEQAIEAAIEADIDDVQVVEGDEDGVTWVLTEPGDINALQKALSASAGVTGKVDLCYSPNVLVDCSDEDLDLNLVAIEALEALDDVDTIEHNMA